MSLVPASQLRTVKGITQKQVSLIMAFLQGAVYSWAKNRKDEQFAVRDLVGGDNFEWEGTPLIVLYEKHVALGEDNESAITDAAKDLGWLLKSVLDADKPLYNRPLWLNCWVQVDRQRTLIRAVT